MKRHAKALIAVVVVVLAFGVSAAFAQQAHKEGPSIDPSPANNGGVPNYAANEGQGGFGILGGLAATAGGGDLFAIDTAGSASPGIEGTGAIHRFDSTGAYEATYDGVATTVGSLSLSPDSHIAADSAGDVFITDTNNNQVVAFDPTGALLTSFSTDGQLDGTETPPGGFGGYLCGIAVDPINGDVLVSDAPSNRVWIFDSSGTYRGRISDSQLNAPCGIAFDSAGDLYVRNWFGANVIKFHRSAARSFDFERIAYQTNNGTPEDGSDDLPEPTDVAVDGVTNNLFVDSSSQITEFDQGGGLLSKFAHGAFQSGSSAAITADGVTGKLYAADGATLRTFATALSTLPDATTGNASNVTDTEATLEGNVDPAGGPDAQCEFEYDTDGSYAAPTKVPCEPAGPFSSSEAVHAAISGLTAATEYHYRLHATSVEGAASGADRSFLTDGPPLIESSLVGEVGSSVATFVAAINPSGSPTTYHFEYTTDSDFQVNGFAGATKLPATDREVGSAGNTAVTVSGVAGDLTPATRYVFRVLATSVVDSVSSDPKSFKTFAEAQGGDSIQFPGRGFLPDNRAWEMVSPVDKNGGEILRSTSHFTAAAECSAECAAHFTSLSGFADAKGGGTAFEYIAKRTATPGTSGWTTHGISPRQESNTQFAATGTFAPRYEGEFSPDLDTAVFRSYMPITDASNVDEVSNLYLRTGLLTANPTTELISDAAAHVSAPNQLTSFVPKMSGASNDFSHVAFQSLRNLTADATGSGLDSIKLYENTGGSVHLVGRVPTAGSSCDDQAGPACTATGITSQAGLSSGYGTFFGQGENSGANYTYNTISDDGSRIFFQSPAGILGGNVYVREDGTRTIQLNASEKSAPESPQPGYVWTASADGSKAFLTTAEGLVEGDDDGAVDIYMYSMEPDSEGHHLTLLSADKNSGDGHEVNGLMGLSDDGSYVYFTSQGQLVPGEPVLGAEIGIYLWNEGEVSFIGSWGPDDLSPRENTYATGAPAGPASDESSLASRVTPDGHHLLFMARSDLGLAGQGGLAGGYDHGSCGFASFLGCRQAYVYDATRDALRCATCNPSGEQAKGKIPAGFFTSGNVLGGTTHVPRMLSDDGRYVFFTSIEKLVPEDRNSPCPALGSGNTSAAFRVPDCLDAYEYDTHTGEVRLLSSGEGTSGSVFLDASADGSDAFILTRDRLSAWDVDDAYDVYDARVGGGLPEPPPPPGVCLGDACQPAPVSLNDPTPASSSFSGAGNEAQRRAKHHRKRRRAHHGPRRKAKQNHHRRTSR